MVLSQTKAELLALGMPDSILSYLSQEDLIEYAIGNRIDVSIAYYRTDKDSNVSIVSEKEALAAVKNDTIAPASISPDDQNETSDSYLRVWHAVEYLGDGTYKFATAARWLVMPFFRMTDSLGSAAMNCTVLTDSESGFYSYDCIHSDASGNIVERLTNEDTKTNFGSRDFQEAIEGTFYGTGAIFELPYDRLSQDEDCYVYSDFNAYVEYLGAVTTPDSSANFNTKGTYDHTEQMLQFSPSLSIDQRGGFSGTIGLDAPFRTSPMTVKLDVAYRP